MPIHLKLSKKELPPGCMGKIKQYAKAMNLYDPVCDEGDQCNGYYAFKALCFLKEPLGEFPKDKTELHIATATNSRPGVYLLTKLHVVLRQAAWEAAKAIQTEFFHLKT